MPAKMGKKKPTKCPAVPATRSSPHPTRTNQGRLKDLSGTNPELEYEVLRRIACGSFSDLYRARRIGSTIITAIKITRLDSKDLVKAVLDEIAVMQQVGHQNLLAYQGSYLQEGRLWVCMEYCSGGSIWDMCQVTGPLPEKQLSFVVKETLQALFYLHEMDKVHRNVKAANILLTEDGRVKLGDFGVSAFLSWKISTEKACVGSQLWMSPETAALNGDMSLFKSPGDIWSLGITCLELAELRLPLSDLEPHRMLPELKKGDYEPQLKTDRKWSNDFHNFVKVTCNKIANSRPSAKELLRHPFIRSAGSLGSSILQLIRRGCDDPEKLDMDPPVAIPSGLWAGSFVDKFPRCDFVSTVQVKIGGDASMEDSARSFHSALPSPSEWLSVDSDGSVVDPSDYVDDEEEPGSCLETPALLDEATAAGPAPPRLWKYLFRILLDKEYCPQYIRWVDPNQMIFRIVDMEAVTRLWKTEKKNGIKTWYNIRSSLKYYEESGTLRKVHTGAYQFVMLPTEYRDQHQVLCQNQVLILDNRPTELSVEAVCEPPGTVLGSFEPDELTVCTEHSYCKRDRNGAAAALPPLVENQRQHNRRVPRNKYKNKVRKAGSPLVLWKFLFKLLLDEPTNQNCIRWINRGKKIFQITEIPVVTELWATEKKKSQLGNYRMIGALRYYHEMGILKKIKAKENIHQFVEVPVEFHDDYYASCETGLSPPLESNSGAVSFDAMFFPPPLIVDGRFDGLHDSVISSTSSKNSVDSSSGLMSAHLNEIGTRLIRHASSDSSQILSDDMESPSPASASSAGSCLEEILEPDNEGQMEFEGLKLVIQEQKGAGGRHKRRERTTPHLWHFLFKLLLDERYSPKYICWINREERIFKFINTKAIARLWGTAKNKANMDYETLARSLRYYHKHGILKRIDGPKLVQQFLLVPDELRAEFQARCAAV